MQRQMTITVNESVYEALRVMAGQRVIGDFLADMVRDKESRTYTEAELEAGYRAMAADKEREQEAREWCEALIGDCNNETR